MAIEGRVTLDLNRRNVSLARLAWNKLTPTRWANTVSGSIAGLATSGPVAITVHQDHLSAKVGDREMPIFRSHAYANSLFRAGVTELEVGKGIDNKEVKIALDSLAKARLSIIRTLAGPLKTEIIEETIQPEATKSQPSHLSSDYKDYTAIKRAIALTVGIPTGIGAAFGLYYGTAFLYETHPILLSIVLTAYSIFRFPTSVSECLDLFIEPCLMIGRFAGETTANVAILSLKAVKNRISDHSNN